MKTTKSASPQDVMRAVLRSSLHMDVISALDHAEAVHRGLGNTIAASVGIDTDEFNKLAALAKTAYDSLAAMRIITDSERSE